MLSNSPARWLVWPTPADAKLYFPELAFTSAASSFTVVAGTDGCTIRTLHEAAGMVIGAKSLIGS
jgi:hypothetical protein